MNELLSRMREMGGKFVKNHRNVTLCKTVPDSPPDSSIYGAVMSSRSGKKICV